MEMDIWKICVSVVATIGSISTIVLIALKFGGNMIAERLSAKYELKLNKELENYKSNLEKKNYISKTRFDFEFCIYGEISEILYVAVEKCYWLFPQQPSEVDETKELYLKRYNEASDSTIRLQSILRSKAPFISEDLLNDFENITKLLLGQIYAYPLCGMLPGRNSIFTMSQMDIYYKRTDEITNKHREIIGKMREYFDSLIVVGE